MVNKMFQLIKESVRIHNYIIKQLQLYYSFIPVVLFLLGLDHRSGTSLMIEVEKQSNAMMTSRDTITIIIIKCYHLTSRLMQEYTSCTVLYKPFQY